MCKYKFINRKRVATMRIVKLCPIWHTVSCVASFRQAGIAVRVYQISAAVINKQSCKIDRSVVVPSRKETIQYSDRPSFGDHPVTRCSSVTGRHHKYSLQPEYHRRLSPSKCTELPRDARCKIFGQHLRAMSDRRVAHGGSTSICAHEASRAGCTGTVTDGAVTEGSN